MQTSGSSSQQVEIRSGAWSRVSSLFFSFREMGILIPLVLICLVTDIINPVFLSPFNIASVLRAISMTAIIAISMTFVLVTGGLDLSIGSIVAMSGMVTAGVLKWGESALPVWPLIALAVLAGLCSGLLVGLFNGVLISHVKIPALIVTLGSLYAVRGLVEVVTGGVPIYPLPAPFLFLGQGNFLGLPLPFFVVIALAVLAHVVLTQTTYGRSVYAVGGNDETARLSGINVERVKLSVYVFSGLLSALSGVVLTSRISTLQPGQGTGWELTVIAAVIIGGTSMMGGSGTILGTLIGTAITGVLVNAMVLTKVNAYWQNVVVGLVIILAVGIDMVQRSQRLKSNRR
jgi:ribose transport system permease protein